MKKQTLIIFSLIICALFLYQCTTVEENTSANTLATKEAASSADTLGNQDIPPDTLTYQLNRLEKIQPDCPGEECTKVEVVYPHFLTGDTGLPDIINQQIQAVISEMLGGYQPDDQIPPNADMDVLAQGIVNEYIKVVEEYGEERPWDIEINGKVEFQDVDVLSIAFYAYDYMGGAHPNSAQRNICLNLNTGNLWMLEELVDDYEKLTALAEEVFRNERELGPEDDFASAGYNFPENKFTLNENFMLTDEGLLFHYNPYEIAPYVLGHTDVLIENEKLAGILKR